MGSNNGRLSLARVRGVMEKLLAGKAITVVVFGGSITVGGVTYRRDTENYFSQIAQWINATFPHPNHVFHNAAVPATGSIFFSVCLHAHIEYRNVDLFIVEFDINDFNPRDQQTGVHYMENTWRRGLEVLFRKLLTYNGGQPAVLYLHLYVPGFNYGSFFNNTIEEETGMLANYYSIPTVSVRNAIFEEYRARTPGFREEDWTCEWNHPNYLGQRYIAELVIAFMQDQLLDIVEYGAPTRSRFSLNGRLPPPMLNGNYESNTLCLVGDDFQKSVKNLKGWDWVDEMNRAGAHRYGFVSTEVDAEVLLQIDTRRAHGGSKPDAVMVGLGILRSYEGLGVGSITCASGCVCHRNVTYFDSTWRERISTVAWIFFPTSQHEHCILRISNMNKTSSGAHKLKLVGLSVLPLSNAAERGSFLDDVLGGPHLLGKAGLAKW